MFSSYLLVLLAVRNPNSMMGDDGAEMFMMTTHNMPLNYLVDLLRGDVREVVFWGVVARNHQGVSLEVPGGG